MAFLNKRRAAWKKNTTPTKTKNMSNTQLTIRQTLAGDYFKKQVALALPKHMTPDRFIRVALTAIMKTPELMECSEASVLKCMLDCSALGLEPDGRRAHLIPYGKTCTLIVDYKGIVELAKRSGDVAGVFAQIVCENDSFSWDTGEVTHGIDFRKPRGDMYAAYAIITFKDGSKQCDVMTKDEIDAIRRRSKARGSGPWVTDYNEMAKKTVFRRASKWVTLSPEVADALEHDSDSIAVDSSMVGQSLVVESEAQQLAETNDENDAVPMSYPGTEKAEDKPKLGQNATPQSELEKIVTDTGNTFEVWRIWADGCGFDLNAISYATWADIPDATCKRAIRAKVGMLKGLESGGEK